MGPWQTLADRLRGGTRSVRGALAPPPESDATAFLDEDFLRQIERLSLTSLDALTEGLMGEHPSRRKTQEIEFADYRGYTSGDDFRQIDWNAYARLGELFVKTALAQENVSLSLLVDCSRSMDWGRPNKWRYARSLAAAFGAVGLLRHDIVRLYALGDGLATPGEPLRDRRALPLLVRELEQMPVAAQTDLRRSLVAFQHTSSHRGVVVLISDLLVPGDQLEALGYLRGDDVTAAVLHVVDAAEAAPLIGGAVELHDRETGELVTLTVTPDLRQRYAARFEARSQVIASICAAWGIRYLQVSTAVPPADLVFGAFRHEGLMTT